MPLGHSASRGLKSLRTNSNLVTIQRGCAAFQYRLMYIINMPPLHLYLTTQQIYFSLSLPLVITAILISSEDFRCVVLGIFLIIAQI